MVADFGFLQHDERFESNLSQESVEGPGDHDNIRAARVLAALVAIGEGRYELDETAIDGMLDAVLSDLD